MRKTMSNSTKTLLCASCGLALVLFAGSCRSRGTSQDTYVGGEAQETQKIEGVSAISSKLQMTNVRHERRDGRLFVQFELHNTKGSNLAFEWSVDWFDDAGFKIDWPEHWTPTSMTGKGFETISVTGPTQEAASWRLMVQKPNAVR